MGAGEEGAENEDHFEAKEASDSIIKIIVAIVATTTAVIAKRIREIAVQVLRRRYMIHSQIYSHQLRTSS